MNYTTNYSEEDYNLVMELRKRRLGVNKIQRYLKSINKCHITAGAISRWIYRSGKIFQKTIINKLKEGYEKLTEEKAYVLGVLCGDGYLSTGYRIGLDVCDLDFAEEFKRCLETTYGIKINIGLQKGRHTNMTPNGVGKDKYFVVLTSKLAHSDLIQYSDFKTHTWIVPNEILKSENLKIKSSFLRGFFDSEGTPRVKKKGSSAIQVCSGNKASILVIKETLLNDFNIEMKVEERDNEFIVLYSERYKDIKNFSDMINFTIKRKKDKLKLALENYKRKGLRHYNKEFKEKVLELYNKGYGTIEIGRISNFPYTNIYDFIKQENGKNI